MYGLLIKAVLTAAFIVALSEIGKRWPSAAGLIVALPLATAMTMALMHIGGEGSAKISTFAWSALIFVPPSCVFLVVMSAGLWVGVEFWTCLVASTVATLIAFWGYAALLGRWGISVFPL